MAQCTGCGKKGLFLKLNARRLCEECAAKAKELQEVGALHISVDGVNPEAKYKDLGHADEMSVCQYFIDRLVERGKDARMFKVEHRSTDYTTLVYDESNDFLRVKMTDRVAWLSIALSDEDCQKYADDPLFYSQENKNQRHWKAYFESMDQLSQFVDMAEHACVPSIVGTPREAKDHERRVADYLYDLFISCGAEPENMFYITWADEFSLNYACAGGIQFKAYAKKPGGYLRMSFDEDIKLNLRSEKNKCFFDDLSDLDCLKDEMIPRIIEQGRAAGGNSPNKMRRYSKDSRI